jgi:RNA polymerase sigma factor (TIGR02999 family)
MESGPGEVTKLLNEWRGGDPEAFEKLVPLVYADLRRIASGLMRRERSDHTLQPTALLHELYFRLVQQRRLGDWADRAHFFAFCAKLMRMILVDHARERHAEKRGGDRVRLPLTEDLSWLDERSSDVIDLDRALDRLEHLDPRKARIAEFRYFLECGAEEIGGLMGLSKATIDRELKLIRAWIYRELRGGEAAGS